MKIDTKKVLKTIDGKDIKNGEGKFTLGHALGRILGDATTAGKMKMYTLAKNLSESKSVMVDVADMKLIKDSVEATNIYNNLVCGQILVILDKIK